MADLSNGWEQHATEFVRTARRSHVGVAIVSNWVQRLPLNGTFLDLGCGPGTQRSDPLHAHGTVYALDAAPTHASAYAERFPQARVACEPAESSTLFARRFDGVLSWGLLFLLPTAAQEAVIRNVGASLEPGGRFLFTAPWQKAAWTDATTRRISISLGRERYCKLLTDAGFAVESEPVDEGENHYYDCVRRDLVNDSTK